MASDQAYGMVRSIQIEGLHQTAQISFEDLRTPSRRGRGRSHLLDPEGIGRPVPGARTSSGSVAQAQECGRRDRGRGLCEHHSDPPIQPSLIGVRGEERRLRLGGRFGNGRHLVDEDRPRPWGDRTIAYTLLAEVSSGRNRTGFRSPQTGLRRRNAGRDATAGPGSGRGSPDYSSARASAIKSIAASL